MSFFSSKPSTAMQHNYTQGKSQNSYNGLQSPWTPLSPLWLISSCFPLFSLKRSSHTDPSLFFLTSPGTLPSQRLYTSSSTSLKNTLPPYTCIAPNTISFKSSFKFIFSVRPIMTESHSHYAILFFSMAFFTLKHTIEFPLICVCVFISCLPPLEWKLLASRQFCLFHSLQEPQCLETTWCIAGFNKYLLNEKSNEAGITT